MIDASVARRYARALLALGLEEGRHEKMGDELAAVLAALQHSKDAAAFLSHPGFTPKQRQSTVDAIAQVLKLTPTMVNFLRLLVERQRIGDLASIERAYRALLDQHVGRVRATVTSAFDLTKTELKHLREALAAGTGSTIVLDAKTDPSIIGGVVTQVGATRYDGSLRTQLDRLRDELKGAPV